MGRNPAAPHGRVRFSKRPGGRPWMPNSGVAVTLSRRGRLARGGYVGMAVRATTNIPRPRHRLQAH
ncbi:hypothetical protein BD413DRAFT_528111 [Trametes elegans]|nr:hypothetical protein BD413DRAFT_528111 [Trametes elegans]